MIEILNIWNGIWPYLVAVLLFLLVIVIHEFGHFSSAKLLKVRVNEFAVGFGPKLFSHKGKETVYSLNLIPLGGYCAMEGEDGDSSDTKAFCNKSPIKRFIIVAMGATFNIILGFILVAVMLAPAKRFASVTVAEFVEGASSESTGLRVNDKILAVDGRRIFTDYDLSYAFTNVPDGKIDITVLRDGEKLNLENVTFDTETEDGITYLKLDFYIYGIKKTFGSYLKQTYLTGISLCSVIWRTLVDMIAGKYGISAVSGPVGVTAAIADVAKQNLFDTLPIMALISINLGIFNLLPIPALDGGRLLFIVIEMIARKPIPKKYEAVIHTAGFVLLIIFMLFIAAKDIYMLAV